MDGWMDEWMDRALLLARARAFACALARSPARLLAYLPACYACQCYANIRPCYVCSTRPVPLHWQAQLGDYNCVVRAADAGKVAAGGKGGGSATEYRAHREVLVTVSGVIASACRRSPSQHVFDVPTDGATLERLVAFAYR